MSPAQSVGGKLCSVHNQHAEALHQVCDAVNGHASTVVSRRGAGAGSAIPPTRRRYCARVLAVRARCATPGPRLPIVAGIDP